MSPVDGNSRAMANTIVADPDLGQVLLEQKPTKGTIGSLVFLFLCGLMMLAFAVPALILMPVSAASIGGGMLFVTVGLALCVFVAIMARRYQMHVFLQEHGICEFRQGRPRSLRYDHVDELTYSSLRIFMQGSYVHTVQKLALKSHSLLGPPLVCTLIFKEADGRSPSEGRSALTNIRDMTSGVIEERLRRELGRNGAIDWTPDLRIKVSGLDVAHRKGGWSFVEWERIRKIEVKDGTLGLWVDSDGKPLVRTSSAQPNFFPAYSLAMRLRK
jgi:hypothetical protein